MTAPDVPPDPEPGSQSKWRVFDPCPAVSPDGYECSGERGHAPADEGDHCATKRTRRGRGVQVEPVFWSEREPVQVGELFPDVTDALAEVSARQRVADRHEDSGEAP